jgi:hydroxymethylpyrimidine pyrophosphatase-like HAD family hydrolase
MTKLFMETVLKESDFREKIIFFGDSPNDEPMFEYFPISCAVANILPFKPMLRHLPSFVTVNEGAEGFAEAADFLLSLKI